MSVHEAGDSPMSENAADSAAAPDGLVLDIADLQAGNLLPKFGIFNAVLAPYSLNVLEI